MSRKFLKTEFLQSIKAPSSLKDFFSECRSNEFEGKKDDFPMGIYDVHNLDSCPWPKTSEGQYIKEFLSPLILQGVNAFINNIRTDLRVLVWGDLVLPVTINQTEYENSYVCSPYSYYVSYAKESLDFISQEWMYRPINAMLWGLGKIFQSCRVNQVVSVNNWFYSTNLYPPLQPQQVAKIAEFLKQHFPDHAIVFRSVDPHANPTCYQTLQQQGFDYIASRQIFFLDPRNTSLLETRLFKSDMRLLKNSGYEIVEGKQLSDHDIPRILELYRSLYIDKYSALNPQYNEEFLFLMLKKGLMHFKALKKEGRVDGIVGYVQRHGMMLCPFFGYDRNVPKEVGLYRMLSTVIMLEAHQSQLFFHQSSGASMFKQIRKASSCFEYTAVYHKHLSIRRKIPWIILKGIYNTLGISYMKRY